MGCCDNWDVMMDWQNLINIGAGAGLGVVGWFARQLWDSVKELKSDIAALKLHVSDAYVKKSEIETLKSEMDKRFDRVEMLLDRLFDKLESKVDK